MGVRVNTAVWIESSQRWRINVQKNGVRRSFYSSKPGRNGQREANRKADAWLDDGIEDQRVKVGAAYLKFLDRTMYYRKVVQDDMIHAYRLAVLTGLRPGELRGLRWQDVKRDRLELHQSTNCYSEITDGKNQNARRCVELSDLARMELEAQRRESGKVTRGTLVFDIPTAKQFEQHLARYCKYNNIPVCTPYELRHTFVSIAKVLPAGLVKSLVGHSEDMDTFGVYGHELNGDAQQQANALNSIFSRLLAHG